jgi:prevent-host-death family protein
VAAERKSACHPAIGLHSLTMSSTYSITGGQADFPKVVKEAQAGYIATITKHDEPVAYVIGKERMQSLIETMEILANPVAMKAIRANEAGKLKSYRIEDIPE